MRTASGAREVVVTGAFDDLRSGQIRFLEEAARLGEVTVLLWSDELVRQVEGRGPKFSDAERAYLLRAIRFVKRVAVVEKDEGRRKNAETEAGLIAVIAENAGLTPDVVVLNERQDSPANLAAWQARGVECWVLRDEVLRGFPEPASAPPARLPGRKRVLVTGCFDYVHSGHVRFFEEVSAYGDLSVVLGHDANLRLLKGPGHPLFPEQERRYVVGAIRYVTQALIATGHGWLDAEPEIQRLRPDIYAVNEDGDKGGKREYCAKMGIEYLVLKRVPAPGLPARTSTDLRGF